MHCQYVTYSRQRSVCSQFGEADGGSGMEVKRRTAVDRVNKTAKHILAT